MVLISTAVDLVTFGKTNLRKRGSTFQEIFSNSFRLFICSGIGWRGLSPNILSGKVRKREAAQPRIMRSVDAPPPSVAPTEGVLLFGVSIVT